MTAAGRQAGRPRRKWEQVIPFFAFAPEVRRIVYTHISQMTLRGACC